MKNKISNINILFHKYFRLDKEYFEAYNAYASGKMKYNWFKKIMFAILGGIFIGLGYTATLIVQGYDGGNSELFKFLGALLFPVGLMLCIYLGGSLFTSNCMGFISLIYKDHKIHHYLADLSLILLGNAIGCITMGLIVWGAGVFGGVSSDGLKPAGEMIIHLVKDKIGENHQWWNNLLSAILCNVLIVGTTILNISSNKSKIAGIGAFTIYLMLVVFAISGYQHVVANFYLFSIGGFLSTTTNDPALTFSTLEVGELVYVNLIPTIFGNLIGGILMSGAYLGAQSYIHTRKIHQAKTQLANGCEVVINDDEKKS